MLWIIPRTSKEIRFGEALALNITCKFEHTGFSNAFEPRQGDSSFIAKMVYRGGI